VHLSKNRRALESDNGVKLAQCSRAWYRTSGLFQFLFRDFVLFLITPRTAVCCEMQLCAFALILFFILLSCFRNLREHPFAQIKLLSLLFSRSHVAANFSQHSRSTEQLKAIYTMPFNVTAERHCHQNMVKRK